MCDRKVIEMFYLFLKLPKGRKNSKHGNDSDDKNSEETTATEASAERIPFDCEGLIDDCSYYQIQNAFHICCEVSMTDFLKKFLYYDKKYGNNTLKMDTIQAGSDKNKELMIALSRFVEKILPVIVIYFY